jgi:predicted aldo/keto reductase-like oxidoreductase
MLKRAYGKTDEQLSILGFGGILVADTAPPEAERLVGQAVDRGINYFDVAPSYGNAEERLGPALEPYRDQVFLACKTTQRDAANATDELHASLEKMRTDHFDLYQLHAMTTQEDFDQATAPGGALEAFIKARDQGLVRYLGFSAHSAETAIALLEHFPFDSVLLPINWSLYINANFGPQVVSKAQQTGAAVLALKALAYSKVETDGERAYKKCWYHPIENPELARLAFRFALSQPITAALPPGAQELFDMALDIAEDFAPITPEEIAQLKSQAGASEPIFRLAAVG